ncbi:MAG: hypothetical protein K0V04_24075, partial [Deltaproteobacteria bacterium]|nr:hypothetical protein [Deltaproteobacteria bacterium]
MHLLVAAGLPFIGDRFAEGWGALLRSANPDGFFESELMAGVYFRTNPHPLTGAYLAPEQTRDHAVKIFVAGLIRTDVAFRCIAIVRSWREYVVSTRRVLAMQTGVRADAGGLPPALEGWCSNYALIRDLAIRGYPMHVVSYDSLLRDPQRVAAEALEWIGHGDPVAAAAVVRRRAEPRAASPKPNPNPEALTGPTVATPARSSTAAAPVAHRRDAEGCRPGHVRCGLGGRGWLPGGARAQGGSNPARVGAVQRDTFTLLQAKTGAILVLPKSGVTSMRVRVAPPLPGQNGTGWLVGGGLLTATGSPVFVAGLSILGLCPSCASLHIPLLLVGGAALGTGI